jgi:molybdopterin-guanine dinucleotide biosynthesis protein A
MRPAAIVLCGGRSRRMGRPKAWLPFGPERLLPRVVRLAGRAAGPVVVVAAPEQDLPPLPPAVLVVRDPVADRGPLQGLAAGLAALPESAELAYLTATDVPFLEPAWITRLAELIEDNDLAIPWAEGFHHPLAALYRRAALLPAAESLLAAERLRPAFLMELVRTRVVTEDELRPVDPKLGTLRNLNTPDDYHAALRDAGLPIPELPPLVAVELFGVPRLRAGRCRVTVEAGTIGEALGKLAAACPGLVGSVLTDGWVHPAYRICINSERFPTDPAEPLVDGDAILLMAADAGG